MRGLLLLLLLTGCTSKQWSTISVGEHSIKVEVAANTQTRSRGLMYRKSLPEDRGMLFIYPDELPRSFWMKNTSLPLSIAYANQAGTIVHIADMTPFSTDRVESGAPATYALEMNKGWFNQHDVKAGDVFQQLPDIKPQ
jgi:uncharacterized membrane protein (UPF0127 family)